MSHNLEMINGNASMFYNKKNGLPWHKLGTGINGAATWIQAMQLAKLDFTVDVQQLFNANGDAISAWGTFRNDTGGFLGTVGEGYTPIQNTEMGKHIDAVIQDAGANYETAGVLKDGRETWAMAAIPEQIRIVGTDDITLPYLLATTAHDGSRSYSIKLTAVRVVCNNTLTAALSWGKGGDKISVRHTKGAHERLDTAIQKLAQVGKGIGTLRDRFNELALRKLNQKACLKTMETLFGEKWQESEATKNKIRDISGLFECNDNDEIPQIRGTAYNLFNACTEYVDHKKTVRKTGDYKDMATSQARTQSAIFGTGNDWKNKALDAIWEATEDCPRKPEPVAVTVYADTPDNDPKSRIDRISSMMDMSIA